MMDSRYNIQFPDENIFYVGYDKEFWKEEVERLKNTIFKTTKLPKLSSKKKTELVCLHQFVVCEIPVGIMCRKR